ncbi:MAG: GIY-YIG nuclease family protein, partial [Actinobacteria bacterium]|nr:GIY-YIG nuclease family protein [Actinomycetota bacterium]
MVYILKNHSNNTVKIGRTKSIDERLRTLQTGNSDRLEPLYILNTVHDAFEAHMHEVCARYHISGEWFEGRVLE